MTTENGGRPRDAAIFEAALDATLAIAARDGFSAVSLTAVAAEAGTSRPALYRRWADKNALLVDAVARLAQSAPPEPTGRPFEDLVAELEHFRHCITDAGALRLAGLMLSDEVTPAVRAAYADKIVAPRRARLRACLEKGRTLGLIHDTADLQVAGSFLTGSWYSFALAESSPPDDWAERTAALVWVACGGHPPPTR